MQKDAQDAFTIWYEMDKDIYQENELFKVILTYIKENNLCI